MNAAEAKKHLKGMGFVPGKSKTIDLAPDVRDKTKEALKVLKADGSLWPFAAEMTKAKKPAASAS